MMFNKGFPTFKIYDYYYSETEDNLLIKATHSRRYIKEHPYTKAVSMGEPKPEGYLDYIFVCNGMVDDENIKPMRIEDKTEAGVDLSGL